MSTKISELPDAQSVGWGNPATATGQVLAPTGTVGAPGFAFGADTDTGMLLEGSNLRLVLGGVRWLSITSNLISPGANPTTLAGFGQKLWLWNGDLKAATANFTVTQDGSGNSGGGIGGLVTNRGATGTVTMTLDPAAGTGASGTAVIVRAMRVANQALRIKPHSGAAFYRAGGTTESADKYLELGSNGAMLEVMWDGTNWLCTFERGTINVEP